VNKDPDDSEPECASKSTGDSDREDSSESESESDSESKSESESESRSSAKLSQATKPQRRLTNVQTERRSLVRPRVVDKMQQAEYKSDIENMSPIIHLSDRQMSVALTAQSTDDDASLVRPAPGLKMSLIVQTKRVQDFIRSALDMYWACHVFECAFPDRDQLKSFRGRALKHAVIKLGEDAILARYEEDDVYAKGINGLLDYRISVLRSEVKKAAQPLVKDFYQPPPSCNREEHFKYLIANSAQPNYIFGSDKGKSNFTEPFFHPAIGAVFRKAWLLKRHEFLKCHASYFKSTIANGAYEVPAPLVSFLACVVHNCIIELRNEDSISVNFSADTYTKVFNSHLSRLKHLQQKLGDIVYHNMMAELYVAFINRSNDDVESVEIVDIAGITARFSTLT